MKNIILDPDGDLKHTFWSSIPYWFIQLLHYHSFQTNPQNLSKSVNPVMRDLSKEAL